MNVSRTRSYQDYGCSLVGVIFSLMLIVGLFWILSMNSPVTIELVTIEPNPDFESEFLTDLPIVISVVLMVSLLAAWLYYRQPRTT